jgi:CBS domain-containing protein
MSSIQSLIHRRVVVLPSHATLSEVSRALADNGIGCVLVSDPKGRAPGIVTDRDLARQWGIPGMTADRLVSEVMTSELVLATENAGLEEIIGLMEEHGIRRVPIVAAAPAGATAGGSEGAVPTSAGPSALAKHPLHFVGLVSLDDLIAARLIDPPTLSRIVSRQIRRRGFQMRPGHAEARAEARKHQTEERFLHGLADAVGIDRKRSWEFVDSFLGMLFARISYTAAMNWVSQLPETVRGRLLALPPGPDRGVTLVRVAEELSNRFGFGVAGAHQAIRKAFNFLRSWTGAGVGEGALEHLKAQLPVEFHAFFEPAAEPAAPERGQPAA